MLRQNMAMADIDDIMAFFGLKTEFQTALLIHRNT